MATRDAQDGPLATLRGTLDFLCQRRLRFRPTPCQKYAPRYSHSNNLVQLRDRDVFHRRSSFQLQGKFPPRFNRSGFSSASLEREMSLRLMKY